MGQVTRRGFVGGAAALGGTVAVGLGAPSRAQAKELGPVRVAPGDPRYEDLAVRRTNQRFQPRPEYFHVVGSTEQVVKAVQDGVRAGKRITVRSGGHCYENFVGEGAQVVIDMCEMSNVYFDDRRGAFAIEAGATLMQAYRSLYLGWGVTIPGGQCGGVAAGGHIAGGGYGQHSRRLGSVVDYLHAVEVVVVDRSGRARAVVATRNPSDPHHDLWWAHTGGGGGNFGVVTRYWMRDPKAAGKDPAKLLPKPPPALLVCHPAWSWADMTRESFSTLLRNHGEWHERNSEAGTPYAGLWSALMVQSRVQGADPGGMILPTLMESSVPDAERLLSAYFAAVTRGVSARAHIPPVVRMPWYQAVSTQALGGDEGTGMFKAKSAHLRRRFTDRQIGVAYDHLAVPGPGSAGGTMVLASYGGRINAVAPGATAVAERSSVIKALFVNTWEEGNGAEHIAWVRRFYRTMYADTGGVPVPGGGNGGAYINYPDIDLADPAWNTSGVPWSTLYYGDNYARLQRVKARWDPRGVFRHALSIRAAR
ncbi:BBE domain-containing protein [Nonomuraea fuscirosea]|uniref:BBE domain-containing protein n=1 Tax=Nonomuraea fuscirosea TaxID=1291556 RepID=UPI002DDBE476|nr:BBE domain-containing protein [Nonomuraea fuscirosea]WSA56415.1 BBE domain-containing protein [Nonomuraea fuscirosea]